MNPRTDEPVLRKRGRRATRSAPRPTKKELIIDRYRGGQTNLQVLADSTISTLSYVASVLQSAGLIEGYFDLYNDSSQPMNAYATLFQKRLGYKNPETALASVRLLHEAYLEFEALGDRAGQHHVLTLAMKMYNRARWGRKPTEAQIFKRWLMRALEH